MWPDDSMQTDYTAPGTFQLNGNEDNVGPQQKKKNKFGSFLDGMAQGGGQGGLRGGLSALAGSGGGGAGLASLAKFFI